MITQPVPAPDETATRLRAAAAYEQRRYHARKAGRWEPFTDTVPVREHLDALRAAGQTLAEIATQSGVSLSTITPRLPDRPDEHPRR